MSLQEQDPTINEDDYDEEADSDFRDAVSDAGSDSSSDEDESTKNSIQVGQEIGKANKKPLIEELDSGDEVTIKERKKSRRRQKRKENGHVSSDEEATEEWRAKTRSMRVHEQEERQKRKLADIKSSTIDVNKIWEELNKPGPLPPIRMEGEQDARSSDKGQDETSEGPRVLAPEEMITIKRQFKFAGDVHMEEKTVPKNSAEARLWLSQQEHKKSSAEGSETGRQRPLRKISRFDPNYSNLEAFRNHLIKAQPDNFNGPKLNVVEKSKMDWASHVDAEGLKEELDTYAKAKDTYLGRTDFLDRVDQRQEEGARLARQKG